MYALSVCCMILCDTFCASLRYICLFVSSSPLSFERLEPFVVTGWLNPLDDLAAFFRTSSRFVCVLSLLI